MVRLGLRSFLKGPIRLLRQVKKIHRSELWLSSKICFVKVVGIGFIGFITNLSAGFMASSSPIASGAI